MKVEYSSKPYKPVGDDEIILNSTEIQVVLDCLNNFRGLDINDSPFSNENGYYNSEGITEMYNLLEKVKRNTNK